MGWVSPTSHSDPGGNWTNDANAYDGVLGTYASGLAGPEAYLALSLVGFITCYKIRIYCSDDVGGDLDEIKVYSKIDGNVDWIHFEGPVPALTWFEISFNSLISLQKIYVRKDTTGNWRLHELQFWSGADGYELLAPEDYIIDNNNVTINTLSGPMQRKLVVGTNGRIHCVFRKCLYSGRISHVYYAYSDDYGKTWTIEDPTPSLTAVTQYTPSIAVDSIGNVHVVFQDMPKTNGYVDVGRYVKRSAGGGWTLSNFYVGSLCKRDGLNPWDFAAGDEVHGGTSGISTFVTFVHQTVAIAKTIGFVNGASGFIPGETIFNDTNPGNRTEYTSETGPSSETSLSISSSGRLVIAAPGPHTYTWYWFQSAPGASLRHALPVYDGVSVTVDVSPSNGIHIVSRNGDFYYYGTIGELICTGNYGGGWYPDRNFSIATDLDNNVHFVVAQTGLGGDFPGVLNIKYYKRISGVWSGPIHITDIDAIQGNPSISIDTQNRIHVMWQGIGWGTYTDKYSLLMRTYENGTWGATQIILNNSKNQGEWAPILLHAWHPDSNRLREPVYIFNRQGSWKIQFNGDFYKVAGPDNLLCEQTKNPTNVSDPQPEFSAIHKIGAA